MYILEPLDYALFLSVKSIYNLNSSGEFRRRHLHWENQYLSCAKKRAAEAISRHGKANWHGLRKDITKRNFWMIKLSTKRWQKRLIHLAMGGQQKGLFKCYGMNGYRGLRKGRTAISLKPGKILEL